MTVAPAPASTDEVAPARVPRLSYFFPAHNEEANLEGLVAEALASLPAIADQFEIIAVDDGSKDRTRRDRGPARRGAPGRRAGRPPPGQPRLRRRRCGRASRPPATSSLAFTDGDRQFRVADLGAADRPPRRAGPARRRRRLPDQARRPGHPHRLRADVQAREPDLLRAQGQGRRLRLQAVPPRGARGRPRRVRRRVLLRGAADQGPGRGRSVAQVGVPHYPRTAGSPTGAKPSVIWRAVKDFWSLRLRMWANRERASRRGRPILGD